MFLARILNLNFCLWHEKYMKLRQDDHTFSRFELWNYKWFWLRFWSQRNPLWYYGSSVCFWQLFWADVRELSERAPVVCRKLKELGNFISNNGIIKSVSWWIESSYRNICVYAHWDLFYQMELSFLWIWEDNLVTFNNPNTNRKCKLTPID